MNRGIVDQAKIRFFEALDAGSMNDRGENLPLEMLAKIMRGAGDKKTAKRLLKYGVELDGGVSQPWKPSMDALGSHLTPDNGRLQQLSGCESRSVQISN